MRSLTFRVTLLAATILAASLSVATALAYELLASAGREHLDETLRRERFQFELSVDELRSQPNEDDVVAMEAAIDRYLRVNSGSDTYFAMITFEGNVHTSEVGPPDLMHLARAGQLPTGTPGHLETVRTSRGDIRLLTTQVQLRDGGAGPTFAVAGSLGDVRADALDSLRLLVIASAVSLAAGSVLLAVALRTTLAPLRAVAAAAGATDLHELDARVPEPPHEDEIAVLAREFNRMLTRLSDAADARRQFLAAVSHELRTPLTIARGHLEVFARTRDADDDATALTTQVVFDELRQMGRLVDDLMTLAHSEGSGFVQLDDVSLDAFFDDLRLRLTGLDVATLHLHEPETSISVRADADRLAQAVLNLVVNAQRHTPDGTAIDVGAHADGDVATITVADAGPGVDPEIRAAMFEPFVTAGTGKAGSSSGRSAGLGLAVVAAIVDAHGGTIGVETGPDGTRISLHIPLAAPSSGARPPRTESDEPQSAQK